MSSTSSASPRPTPPSSSAPSSSAHSTLSSSSFIITPSASSSSTSSSSVLDQPVQVSRNANDDDNGGEVDSLPSLSTDEIESESDSVDGQGGDVSRRRRRGGRHPSDSDAQREWERSLDQLQLLMTMVLVPFVGKYLGRKFAYWSWARYMEWMHGVEVRWTSKRTFQAAGAVEAASSL